MRTGHETARGRRWSARVAMVLAGGALALAGCGGDDDEPAGDSAGSPATKGAPAEITVALSDAPAALDPQAAVEPPLQAVTDNIYEALMGFTEEAELEPVLAADAPERVDPQTWRFKIRDGVEFTNGEPLDAEAVAFSINRIIDPKLKSTWTAGAVGDNIKEARVVDPTTVEVVTKEPDPLLPNRTVFIAILPPKYFETETPDDAAANPVGTGPFKWVEGAGAGPIVLERNPDYWGEAPELEKVTFRSIPDLGTRLSALKAGEVDLITELSPDAADDVPKLFTSPSRENFVVRLKNDGGMTADPNVRRALNLAVDKESLTQDLMAGYGEVSRCQPIPPTTFGYNDSLEAVGYDPEEAKRLIQEAGVEGETIRLVSGAFYQKGGEIAQVLGAFWTEIGLKVDVKVLDLDRYVPVYYESKGDDRPEAIYVATSEDLFDAISAQTKGLAADSYPNPEVHGLFDDAAGTDDRAERETLLNEALGIACEDQANVDLINPQDLWGGADTIEWTPRPDDQQGINFAGVKVTG